MMAGGIAFRHLFEPETIAFIGSSTNLFKWGFNVLHNIIRRGFAGKIYPVNPGGGDWFGRTVYTSLDEIPSQLDLAIIVVKDTLVKETIEKCVARHIPMGIVITAGFSETGENGARLEREIVETARKGGMRLVGPNTMGIFSAYPGIMHGLMGAMPLIPGPVGLIVQSGNLGSSISYRFLRRNIGISRLISSGNEGDLTLEDYLEYLEEDDKTSIICLYVEGLRDGKRFFDAARRISKKKPILLMKGGRTEMGAKAAMSHTGAIASNDEVFRAMCTQAGIIRIDTMDEMIDVAGILIGQPIPRGNRIGIITLGGGWGVIATDTCTSQGLVVEPLPDAVIHRLDQILPAYWSRGNPIDLVAPPRVEAITDAVGILMEYANIDAALVMGLGYMSLRAHGWRMSDVIDSSASHGPARIMISEEMKLFRLLADLIEKHKKPIVPVVDIIAFDVVMNDNPLTFLESRGIMAYHSPAPAIKALAKVMEYSSRMNISALSATNGIK
ncbi:MAG TPA: CoA-binding protein [Deltaproteobacteria bacterium]|nr:CoA-binding protein [Deltaproteobacteria bacterium]